MSLFSPSSQQADTLFAAFTLIGTVGGLFALLGGAGAYWAGTVREKYAEERTQKNELDIAAANKAAAEAQVTGQRISLEVAVANKVAAEAQLRSLEIQQHLGPRRLKNGQKTKLIDSLQGKGIRLSLVYATDQESSQYANDFLEVFTRIDPRAGEMSGPQTNETGLVILHSGQPEAQLLASALQEVGLQVTARLRQPHDPRFQQVTLVVGGKTPP